MTKVHSARTGGANIDRAGGAGSGTDIDDDVARISAGRRGIA